MHQLNALNCLVYTYKTWRYHNIFIYVHVGLLCDLKSKQQVTQLIKEAEDLKQEYKTQQAQFCQLAHVKDRMQKCQKAFQDKIGDLEFEENVKLLEQGLEKNQREPYTENKNSGSKTSTTAMMAGSTLFPSLYAPITAIAIETMAATQGTCSYVSVTGS